MAVPYQLFHCRALLPPHSRIACRRGSNMRQDAQIPSRRAGSEFLHVLISGAVDPFNDGDALASGRPRGAGLQQP